MWASDRDKAWAEAERRYGALPEQTADTYRIDSVTTHERTGVQRERHLTGQPKSDE